MQGGPSFSSQVLTEHFKASTYTAPGQSWWIDRGEQTGRAMEDVEEEDEEVVVYEPSPAVTPHANAGVDSR